MNHPLLSECFLNESGAATGIEREPTFVNYSNKRVLEITSQIMIVPPYFESLGKRLVKTPKVYWGDSGLACYLLGITSEAELQRSPFLGQLHEGFVAAEILKSQVNQGGRKELYYFRDHQGLQVDFLLPRPNAGLWLIECKAGKTVRPAMAAPLLALRRTMEKPSTV